MNNIQYVSIPDHGKIPFTNVLITNNILCSKKDNIEGTLRLIADNIKISGSLNINIFDTILKNIFIDNIKLLIIDNNIDLDRKDILPIPLKNNNIYCLINYYEKEKTNISLTVFGIIEKKLRIINSIKTGKYKIINIKLSSGLNKYLKKTNKLNNKPNIKQYLKLKYNTKDTIISGLYHISDIDLFVLFGLIKLKDNSNILSKFISKLTI